MNDLTKTLLEIAGVNPDKFGKPSDVPATDEEAVAILGVAEFAFLWNDPEMFGPNNPMEMFHLTKSLGGHPKGSTLTRTTLLKLIRAVAVKTTEPQLQKTCSP